MNATGVALAAIIAYGCAAGAGHTPLTVAETRAVPSPPPIQRALLEPRWSNSARAFYEARSWRPVFVDLPSGQLSALLDTIDALVDEGLPPVPGTIAQARRWLTASDPDTLAALDLLVAEVWVEAARGLSGARLVPEQVDSLWSIQPAGVDGWVQLSVAAQRGRLAADLAALRPTHEQYGRLRDALVSLRASGGNPGAPEVERTLVLNLERWRWLPQRMQRPYLLVNIPAFALHAVDSAGEWTASRVILGRSDWRTPLVQSEVTHVVLAPPWRVPAEIVRQEIIPLMRADSTYVRRHDFQVYRGAGKQPIDPASIDWSLPDSALKLRLVQRPGPTNPLGRVKLVFANEFAVALHDTPAPELFTHDDRALSHGCVRVEDAVDLAARLIAGANGWDAARLARAAEKWETRWITLPRPVPVYVTYFTAWVDGHGVLRAFDDIYGWDAALARALGL